MERIGDAIITCLRHPNDEKTMAGIDATVRDLTERFPLYPGLSYL